MQKVEKVRVLAYYTSKKSRREMSTNTTENPPVSPYFQWKKKKKKSFCMYNLLFSKKVTEEAGLTPLGRLILE